VAHRLEGSAGQPRRVDFVSVLPVLTRPLNREKADIQLVELALVVLGPICHCGSASKASKDGGNVFFRLPSENVLSALRSSAYFVSHLFDLCGLRQRDYLLALLLT
jgi:hypothetical protein